MRSGEEVAAMREGAVLVCFQRAAAVGVGLRVQALSVLEGVCDGLLGGQLLGLLAERLRASNRSRLPPRKIQLRQYL